MTPFEKNRSKVAVSGVGFTKPVRHSDTPLARLALESVTKACEDTGIKISDIDGLSTYPVGLGGENYGIIDGLTRVSMNCMMTMLKLPIIRWHIQQDDITFGGSVIEGANALIAGVCNYVLVWRALTNPPGSYNILPGERAVGNQQFSAPYGFGGGAMGRGTLYRKYLETYHQQREKMGTWAVTERKHAQLNPYAFFCGTPLTMEEYLNSRMISYPLCLFDCDIPVVATAAAILTTAERARDLKPHPAYLNGYGARSVFEIPGRTMTADWLQAGWTSTRCTWANSGFTPKDIDYASIYDGYMDAPIYSLEPYGFCGPGETPDFIQNGTMELDGKLPMNTFGGALSCGRIQGIYHFNEAVLQTQHRAGGRQIKDAEVCFAGCSAPVVTGTTFVFTHAPLG